MKTLFLSSFNKLRTFFARLLFISLLIPAMVQSAERHSCSTFMINQNDTLLVGHNLDDYIEVPGLIVVNPRGVAKHSISWDDLKSVFGRSKPKLRWTSQYASITYNTFGKEFPDGGMNEAGLYVGEMTLFATQYPDDESLTRLYHHFWMQYVLDRFQTVDEVIADVQKVIPSGHCLWHFFVADRTGNSAVIEFIGGRTVIHAGKDMPVKALCNRSYKRELDSLKLYEGFGDTRKIILTDTSVDRRFSWAFKMIADAQDHPPQSMVGYSFSVLNQMNLGNNKWSVVCDLKNSRIYFNTYLSRKIKWADLNGFDLSGKSSAMVLDVHSDLEFDVSKAFIPFTEDIQKEYVKKAWEPIDTGFIWNLIFKPVMTRRLRDYIIDFKAE